MKKNVFFIYNLIFIVIFILLFLLRLTFFNRNLVRINGDEISFNYFIYNFGSQCRYQTKNGFDFLIRDCEHLQLYKYYTIIGRVATFSDNKNIYKNNFEISQIFLSSEPIYSYNLFFLNIRQFFYRFFDLCLVRILFVIDTLFSVRAQPLIKSLFLGSRVAELGSDLKDQITGIGLAHMVAVSGFHLSLIFVVLSNLLNKFFNKKISGMLLFLFLLTYIYLVGTPLSVVRAFLMLIIALIASTFFHKLNNSLFSLFLVFILMSLMSIFNIFNVGFQLSFLATLGVLLSLKLMIKSVDLDLLSSSLAFDSSGNSFHKFLRLGWTAIKGLILTSLGAQLATLPIVINVFGAYSLYSILSSVVFSSLISLLMTVLFYLILVALFLVNYFWLFFFFILPFVGIINYMLDYFFLFFDWYCINFSRVLSFDFTWSYSVIFWYYFVVLIFCYSLNNRASDNVYFC